MKIFDTRSKDIVLYSMKMFNVSSPYHDTIKRKCKFLHNVMSSTNLLCQICKYFGEKELRGYSCPDCAQYYCFFSLGKFLFNLIYLMCV